MTITTADHERVSRTITGDRHTAATRLAQLAAEHGHPPGTLNTLVAVRLGALAERDRSPSTLRRYEQLWRTWLSPLLGPKHLDDLHRADIEAALRAMHEAGQSPRSIHQAAVLLNTTLAWGPRTPAGPNQPGTRLRTPRPNHPHRHTTPVNQPGPHPLKDSIAAATASSQLHL